MIATFSHPRPTLNCRLNSYSKIVTCTINWEKIRRFVLGGTPGVKAEIKEKLGKLQLTVDNVGLNWYFYSFHRRQSLFLPFLRVGANDKSKRIAGETENVVNVADKKEPSSWYVASTERNGRGRVTRTKAKEKERGARTRQKKWRCPFIGTIYCPPPHLACPPIVREFERLYHRNFISVRPRDITVRSFCRRSCERFSCSVHPRHRPPLNPILPSTRLRIPRNDVLNSRWKTTRIFVENFRWWRRRGRFPRYNPRVVLLHLVWDE